MIEDAFPTDERKIEDLQMPLIPKRHGSCSSWQGPAAVVYDHVIISICKQRLHLLVSIIPVMQHGSERCMYQSVLVVADH